MDNDNIVLTRIAPKLPQQGIIKRERLLRKIQNNIEKSLFSICAPAGYGKTTLVQDFLNRFSYKYTWLKVHSDINNFYSFITYLIYSIQRINRGFGKGTLLLIDDYRERLQFDKNLRRIITDVTTSFLNEFYVCFKEDVIIVIDDLGDVGSSDWLKETFRCLLENVPSNMHFLVTSRSKPDISTSILQAKRNLVKIETSELTFTDSEIKELLIENYNIQCDEKDINTLKENMSGWITGIHLILQSYGSEFPKLHLEKILILEDIYNYFTEDIFNNLDDNYKEFLLKTSVLESFSAKLCNDLFYTAKSKEIIDELLSRNIFIQVNPGSSDGLEQTFSYQTLFKKFLTTKLNELKSSKEVRTFLKKIYEYYLNKENYLLSINYALSAEEYQAAIELIGSHFQENFEKGNLDLIWNWFKIIDPAKIENNVKMLYYKSMMLKVYKGNVEESLSFLNRAIMI
ncbi:MAG TPA: hypothetical protein VGK25_06685, partial [Ignavibacteria bacterium]